MKKLMILAAALLAFGTTTVRADDDRPINVDQLPQKAQQFIRSYFPSEKVSLAKMENDLFGKSYEVIFANSSKVEFAKDGEWTDVDCKYASVPEGIVPAQIASYVGKNYPGVAIVGIDRDKRDYEVKLGNGLELTFDLKFNLIDIDD